ncbi:MAG: ABC transporter permease, partial [Dehalococcoidia bacterium]
MPDFVMRRFFYMLLVIVAASMLVFGLSRVKGDPRLMYINRWTTQEAYDAMGRAMGLDKPLVVQYLI